MEKGIVYWITGLSGAGKSTIGNRLYYELKKKVSNLVILDGDILKNIVSDSLGYSKEDRLKKATHYSNICKVLADQGIDVIICTISMYDSVREWNRNNIERYVEIFLDVSKETLIKRDRKGLYSGHQAGVISDVVGMDYNVEFPKKPDIIIENNGTISANECVRKILNYTVQNRDCFDRDIGYWDRYYSKDVQEIKSPSDFARSIIHYLKNGESLIDLGCGNGRDSIFFASRGIEVTGIDASEVAIRKLNEMNIENATFICDDFVTSRALYQVQYDYLYSRWAIHAISERQEDEWLQNVSESLKTNGLLFVEAKSINDELCRRGKQVSKNAYVYNGQYSRLMDKECFQNKLLLHGFDIISSEEGKGFSKIKESNPTLVRIIARKAKSEI